MLTMSEWIESVMNISFTAFAVYGTFVLYKWRQVAKKVEDAVEELRNEDAE